MESKSPGNTPSGWMPEAVQRTAMLWLEGVRAWPAITEPSALMALAWASEEPASAGRALGMPAVSQSTGVRWPPMPDTPDQPATREPSAVTAVAQRSMSPTSGLSVCVPPDEDQRKAGLPMMTEPLALTA